MVTNGPIHGHKYTGINLALRTHTHTRSVYVNKGNDTIDQQCQDNQKQNKKSTLPKISGRGTGRPITAWFLSVNLLHDSEQRSRMKLRNSKPIRQIVMIFFSTIPYLMKGNRDLLLTLENQHAQCMLFVQELSSFAFQFQSCFAPVRTIVLGTGSTGRSPFLSHATRFALIWPSWLTGRENPSIYHATRN